MKLISLQSGSNGNCIYVQARGVRLLFDVGITGSQAQQRLDGHGQDIAQVDALLISHNHRDHARSRGIFQRKFGLPIHVTRPTLAAAQASMPLGDLSEVRYFTAGSTLDFGAVQVETIPTPHDGVAFVVDDGRSRLGILTDLGHVFREDTLGEFARSALREGPYTGQCAIVRPAKECGSCTMIPALSSTLESVLPVPPDITGPGLASLAF